MGGSQQVEHLTNSGREWVPGEVLAEDPLDFGVGTCLRAASHVFTPIDVQGDLEMRVGMLDRGDKGADCDVDCQLFLQLTYQSLLVGLVGLDLAAGELPQASKQAWRGAFSEKITAVLRNCRRHKFMMWQRLLCSPHWERALSAEGISVATFADGASIAVGNFG